MNTQPTTINTKFDASALPRWARNHPEVIALCERNLAYRCDVCRATTRQYRNHLIRIASR